MDERAVPGDPPGAKRRHRYGGRFHERGHEVERVGVHGLAAVINDCPKNYVFAAVSRDPSEADVVRLRVRSAGAWGTITLS